MTIMVALILLFAAALTCACVGGQVDRTRSPNTWYGRMFDRMLNGPRPIAMQTWTPPIPDGIISEGNNLHVPHPDLLEFAITKLGEGRNLVLHAHPLSFNYSINNFKGSIIVDGARLTGENLTNVTVIRGEAKLKNSIVRARGEKACIMLDGGYADVRDGAHGIVSGKKTRATVRRASVSAYKGATIESYENSRATGMDKGTRVYLYDNAEGSTMLGAHLACFHQSLGISYNTPNHRTNGTLWPLKSYDPRHITDEGDVFCDGEHVYEVVKSYVDLTHENRAENRYELRVLTLRGAQAGTDNIEYTRDELYQKMRSTRLSYVHGKFNYENDAPEFVTPIRENAEQAKTQGAAAYFNQLDEKAS